MIDLVHCESNSNDMMSAVGKQIRVLGYNVNSIVLASHGAILLYSMAFFIQASTLPYLTKSLGVDPVMYGYLETAFAISQLIGGPLFGRFGDVFGGRKSFILAFISASCSYGILGFAHTIPVLFLSRLPVIFMHAMQAGQMVVTDVGSSTARADALGKLGISYGVGMVTGPLFGGQIIKYFGEHGAALTACFLSLLSVLYIVIYIPNHTKSHTSKQEIEKESSSLLDFKKWSGIMKLPGVSNLLLIKLVVGLPLGAWQGMASVIFVNSFNLNAQQNGYVLSYIGTLLMAIQGFAMKFLTQQFSESSLIKIANCILIFSWFSLTYASNIWIFCIIMVPHVFGMVVQGVVISSILTKLVPSKDTGSILGINMATHSIIRMLGPTLGGYLYQSYGFTGFGYFGCLVCTGTFTFAFYRL